MKLFTSQIDKQLFAQYDKGDDLKNQKVVAKIFNPYGKGTWYLLNSDPNDPDYIWAIVDLVEIEMGSVSRSELESIKVPPFRLSLERDLSFTPINAAQLYFDIKQGRNYANGGTTKINSDVKLIEDKIGKNYLFPNNSNPDTIGIEFAKGGNIKSIKKDESYRYRPNGSIESKIMDKVSSLSGYNFAGNFFIDGQKSDHYIYFLDEYDRNYVKDVELKSEERIYRYITRNSAIGGMIPLVKINIENGLIYYPIFKDEDVLVGFDRKGQKARYLNLVEVGEDDYYDKGGYMADGGMMAKGGITGDVHSLTDKMLSKKIQIFIDNVKPIKYYYIDEKSNSLVVGLDENYTQDAADKFYREATLSMEFFDADSVDMEYNPKTKDTQYTIKLKKPVKFANGGITDEAYKKRIKKFGFKPYGKTKGIYTINYMVDGKPHSEIWETKEMAVSNAKRYSKIDELSNIEIIDEKGKKISYAMGGEVKFADKVKSIKSSLLKRKKVSPKVQKDYGKTYSPKEAEESAKRIVGAMRAK